MATISTILNDISIPGSAAQAQDLLDTIVTNNGWTASSPLTRQQFFRRMVIDFLRSQYIVGKGAAAQSTAATSADTNTTGMA